MQWSGCRHLAHVQSVVASDGSDSQPIPLPRLMDTDFQASPEFGSKHWFGDRAVEETEEFPLRNLQLNWLSRWFGGRVK